MATIAATNGRCPEIWEGGGSFIANRNLGVDKIVNSLHGWANGSEGKLDYMASFVDMTTNYCEHTGTQTVARSLISRAAGEI